MLLLHDMDKKMCASTGELSESCCMEMRRASEGWTPRSMWAVTRLATHGH